MIISNNGIPGKIRRKALDIIKKWQAGEIKSFKLYTGGETIRVGLRYRLYRKNENQQFTLYSSEDYHKICDR